jgi:hypothetical protein
VNSTYHYVVLRLSTDDLRGELINVGVVLFPPAARPHLLVLATLNKLRALDATWDSARLAEWTSNVQQIVNFERSPTGILNALSRFKYCDREAVGSFLAESHADVAKNLADIKATYIANRAAVEHRARERRPRLQTALKEQFKRMQVLGVEAADVAQHLVVPNVPVPNHPELRTDFVYKNGEYRITQALDYHIAPDSVHNKLAEACVKSTAAELAVKAYGPRTLRLAVFDIPEALADAVDAHVDLLHAQGFEIFHFRDPNSMANYLAKGAPASVLR